MKSISFSIPAWFEQDNFARYMKRRRSRNLRSFLFLKYDTIDLNMTLNFNYYTKVRK